KFKEQGYYDYLQKFITTLEKIKRFVDEFSNMKSINKTFRATEIKEKFESLAEEFDNSMKHLNFSMTIDFEEQRKLDTDELKSSLNEIKKILKISGFNSEVISEINIMKSRDTFVFKPFQIEPKDLTPCSLSPDEFSRIGNSSYLCKRMYKFEEMIAGYSPKIANFDVARKQNETTNEIPDLNKVVRWMAPEKINGDPYTTRCEIFSFGMLLWELTYEKEPYHGIDTFEDIKKLVTNGYREKISFAPTQDQKIKEIQQKFEDIMKSTWHDNPRHRIGVGELYVHLENLAEKYVKPGDLPKICNNNEIDFDGSKFYEIDEIDMDFINQTTSELKFNLCDVEIKVPTPLNEGLKIHQSINKE
ncbi:32714_t:CDS:2, partial [Racocetra persica]